MQKTSNNPTWSTNIFLIEKLQWESGKMAAEMNFCLHVFESKKLTSKSTSFCKQESAPGHQEEESCFQQGEAVQLGKLCHVKSLVKGNLLASLLPYMYVFIYFSIYEKTLLVHFHVLTSHACQKTKHFWCWKMQILKYQGKFQTQLATVSFGYFCCISITKCGLTS